MSIHEHIAERVELAGYYAQDGAFKRAATILRDLAADIEVHAEKIESELAELARGLK